MKRLYLLIPLLLAWGTTLADIQFKFSSNSTRGVSADTKARMEYSVSALLTEITAAGNGQRELSLSEIRMEEGAKKRLHFLWNDIHLTCVENMYVENCLNDMQGYQIRGIDVKVLPLDDTYTQSTDRELTISLNRQGVITGVRLALENNEEVSKILREGSAVSDMAERREILKWVEDFRCYYNEKNIAALEQIYSDDALIITGSVVTSKKIVGDEGPRLNVSHSDVRYKVLDKNEYLKQLRDIFRRNQKLYVSFDNISVSRDGSRHNIYGVKLKQTWESSTYSDEGWLFLLWDFGDKDHPQIHVRTWQPGSLKEDEVFSLPDFP